METNRALALKAYNFYPDKEELGCPSEEIQAKYYILRNCGKPIEVKELYFTEQSVQLIVFSVMSHV